MAQPPDSYYFTHDPIDLSGHAFRLLRILKGKGPVVCCELFQAWVRGRDVAISYDALSYVWGSPEANHVAKINGKPFRIAKNLYDALQRLQLADKDRIVWVDAICIDQSNKAEQGHQVDHMGDIYKRAAQVIYWLGLPTPSTKICLDALGMLQHELKAVSHVGWTRQQWMELWKEIEARPTSFPGLQREGLLQLLDRDWFRRVWILQEVAHSQAAVVYCGAESVSARVFAIAPFLMGITPEPRCQAVLDMMPSMFRKETWSNGNRYLHMLLQSFGDNSATDPRDLVYALLGISSDAIGHIYPDYNKTEAEVVDTVFTFLFHVKIGPTIKSARICCIDYPAMSARCCSTTWKRRLLILSQPRIPWQNA
ncbi:heterokaryon incompatibility protein-domain-containing protein [Lasiosphaeria hispida]|uniref:Heterokaryon incompatibility protein-domain-containing protein n=1 Tax=Lasiosphaeria hispida TaxID=260671 RepID=A0AAJ0H5J6_9PEZI|nr:heterokaryon incompatibility protein-domain-containing protein [Lasiosphaeria hispida]